MEFRILGPLEVCRGGSTVGLGGRRQRTVLARLLVEPGHVVSIDRLVEDVWPADPPRTAVKTLHKYVSVLRAALGSVSSDAAGGVLRTSGPGYLLEVDAATLDSRRFEDAVAGAREARRAGDAAGAAARLSAADALWRGDVLADFITEDFTAPLRRRLEELRVTALEERFDAELASGRAIESVAELSELVVVHPFRERLWALLMTALAAAGRLPEALRAFQRCRHLLAEELGLEPSAELRGLESRLLRGDAVAPALASPSVFSSPTNVPAPVTSFIGRHQQLRDLVADVAGHRLVTLTGPGGCGKSRLAVEAARRLLVRFPGGVWFVDLLPIGAARQVAGAIARAVRVADVDEQQRFDVVVDALNHRPATLLLLDNCEHVAAECAEVVTPLLGQCAALTVIAASRRPLDVPGEAIRRVRPLDVATEAAQLFCDRASLCSPTVAVHADDQAVIEICRRLDGLPLAVEVAAGMLQYLDVSEIVQRLRQDPWTLERAATAVTCHRSLWETMTSSYDLLAAPAQLLLGRLSVFPASFRLDAAEAACGDRDGEDVLASLGELVRMSLVTRVEQERGGGSGYRLLDTIRSFANEMSRDRGDHDVWRRRHATWVLTLARSAMPHVLGPEELRWRDRLDLASHDVETALHFTSETDATAGIELVLALWPHWLVWGHFRQGLGHLRRLLHAESAVHPALRAWASVAAADLAADAGHSAEASGFATAAMDVFRRRGDPHAQAYAERALANVAYNNGDADGAQRLLDRALGHLDGTGDEVGISHVGYLLGHVQALRGDLDAAEESFRAQLRWFEALGSQIATARAEWILGRIAHQRGDQSLARSRCERSLDHLLDLEDAASVARVRLLLGDITASEGDPKRADGLYRMALAGAQAIGDHRTASAASNGLAACREPLGVTVVAYESDDARPG
jgi:predicted ATPase/DNA-binding SARP family transcriptional activator